MEECSVEFLATEEYKEAICGTRGKTEYIGSVGICGSSFSWFSLLSEVENRVISRKQTCGNRFRKGSLK